MSWLEPKMMTGLLILFRISALVMTIPLIGTKMVNTKVKLILSVCMTIVVLPIIPLCTISEYYSPGYFISIMQECLIGIILGFMFQVAFQIFVMAGEIVSMQMGLSFASLIDPTTEVHATILSQFYLFLVSLLFLMFDGHLAVMQIICESFFMIPLNKGIPILDFFQIVTLVGLIFVSALKISLPICIALLIVTVGLGVMTKSVPQLNIFSISMPINMLIGVLLVWLSIKDIKFHYDEVFKEFFNVADYFIHREVTHVHP